MHSSTIRGNAASIPPSPGHEREWLDSIKTRQQPSCNVAYHYKLDAAIGLANISYRLGRTLNFDAATMTCKGDAEANKMFTRNYRAPFVVPDGV